MRVVVADDVMLTREGGSSASSPMRGSMLWDKLPMPTHCSAASV